MVFPRAKTGVMRVGFLWKKTRAAPRRVRTLKHNRVALAAEGESSLVFITRKGLPYHREREVHSVVEIEGRRVKKLVAVVQDNPIGCTFGRMARELGLDGVSFYRLRHTFKTLGKRVRDREALDAKMGHKDASTGKVYDHEALGWRRVKQIARAVYRGLWPKVKPKAEMRQQSSALVPVEDFAV